MMTMHKVTVHKAVQYAEFLFKILAIFVLVIMDRKTKDNSEFILKL